jgi:DNA-directed RNA polymerase specialized sigma24 family protein
MRESDASVVSRPVTADPAVFVGLLRRHGQAVHAYLARRCGSDDDDLLSEVWLHAFEARATYDRRWQDARPWLYGIARNVLRAHWRRRGRASPPGDRESSDPWPDVDTRLDAMNLAAWSVNTNPDGTVTLTMRQEDHTALLQRVLREAGVPTMVRVNERCGPTFHRGAAGRVLGGGMVIR